MRECAQEIIAAHILQPENLDLRDSLIQEYAERHGPSLALVVYDFVSFHYAEQVEPDEAVHGTGRFLFTLGDLIEDVAEVGGMEVEEVLHPLIASDFTPPDFDSQVERQLAAQIAKAVRAAQTTLAAHFIVRRGSDPIGIQRHLNLDDMCVVVRGLSALGTSLVESAVEWGVPCSIMIEILLAKVEAIMCEIAEVLGKPVGVVISDYWMALSSQDAGQ